jgi:Spy/CpxP family protein refolding chaperone
MKKIISVFALAALMSVAALAQDANKDQKKGNDDAWREKVRAEQVAFITSELNLTEGEAQKFWPVYNDVQSQRREAYKESFEAMKELEESIQNNKDQDKKLDKYVNARKKIAELENDSVKKYSKVLPKDKVAKLVLTEERFRHNQIGKLGKGGMPGGHGPGKKFQKEQ